MGNPSLEAMILQKYQKAAENIASKVAPEINKLLKESVEKSIAEYYKSYTPEDYQRTYNFMKVVDSSKTTGNGNNLIMSVNSGYMNNYPGFSGRGYGNTYSIDERPHKYEHPKLNASIAFDFFFKNGEHGHGDWLKATSTPPDELVQKDIDSKFDGKANKIILDALNKEVMKG